MSLSSFETNRQPPEGLRSLIAKMKIYNTTERSFREVLRSVADSGIDIRYYGDTVEWLRSHDFGDVADFVEGIGETQYRNLLRHYGVREAGEFMRNQGLSPGPGDGGQASSDAADFTGKQSPDIPKLPTEEEIMAAMLDAFEQDVNITDKRKVIKWLADHQYSGVAQWFETLERADFYKAVSSFFANLGKVRERLPEVMSGDLKEQASFDSPSVEIPPEIALDAPTDIDVPFKREDVYTILMDMYLEGMDVTRRTILVGELDKGGHEVEAEYIDGLSLAGFYNLLSEFFARLAKAMEQKTGKEKTERKIFSTVDPLSDPQKTELIRGFDPEKAKALWNALDSEGRKLALMDVGFSKNIANLYADDEWRDLPKHIQDGYIEALIAVAESKKGDLQIPFGRRRKGMRKMLAFEAPEELLPAEVEEFVSLACELKENGETLAEAAKKAAFTIGTKKKMPSSVIQKVEVYLGKIMKEEFGQTSAPSPLVTKTPVPPEEDEPAPEKKVKPSDDETKPTVERRKTVVDKMSWDAADSSEREDLLKSVGGLDARLARKYSAWKWDELPDIVQKSLVGESDDDLDALGEMRRLALMPSKFHMESLKPPVGILFESTTASGAVGAPGVGMLDVFAFGGYLDRALPYLISASLSRMDDEDKSKFMTIYNKFVETNDINQLTELSGKLADAVEWGDATQEGTELVKTLRFLSDFLNMLRGSVDYTKKVLSRS